MRNLLCIAIVASVFLDHEAIGQWSSNGSNIFNTNSGFVGIGNNSPLTLLHVKKDMTEPGITVQNLGGFGGATYSMIDDASGANWKFKATLTGGFKIRDHANGLDVFFIEPNSAANLLYLKAGGRIGIGTTTPHNSALVDMSSTARGFLPPRMTTGQLLAISSPAEGLMIYNTSTHSMVYFNGSEWKGTDGSFICGTSFTKNHVTGSVAPVTKTVTYATVDNIPGETSKCWITSNLGSDHQATAVDDATEASAGWYWQFNRMQGYKHDGSVRTPNTTWITTINESSDWLSANDPCALLLGNGWRLPTSTEWANVDATGAWNNWSGPWNSPLHMHAAGWLLNTNGSLSQRGFGGGYNSRTQYTNAEGWHLYFDPYNCYPSYSPKPYALSVRCLSE